MKLFRSKLVAVLVGTAALAVIAIAVASSQAADSYPADKMTVTASQVEVTDPGQAVTLMSAKMRTSTPEDLVFQVTAECALTTNVTTVGNDDQSAQGTVRVWVEVDGKPVTITKDDTTGGKVVFCNRAYHRTTSGFDEQSATIQTFFDTRESNAFNWVKFDVGNGIHTITVKGDLTATATNNATAKAAIGNRTLVVEPTKAIQQ